jgi:hypothetical protein
MGKASVQREAGCKYFSVKSPIPAEIAGKSARVNGPAIAGRRVNTMPSVAAAEAFRKPRRFHPSFPEPEKSHGPDPAFSL